MATAPGKTEVLTRPIYDSSSVVAAAGATNVTLCQQGVGQGTTVWGVAGTKTLEDTNLRLNGQLPVLNKFAAYTIQFQPDLGITVANYKILMAAGVLQVVVADVPRIELPIDFAVAGAGGTGVSNVAATDLVSHGLPQPKNVFTLEDPIEINPNESFNVPIFWSQLPGLTGTVKFRLLFQGRYQRGG